jgi:hypothetical protein
MIAKATSRPAKLASFPAYVDHATQMWINDNRLIIKRVARKMVRHFDIGLPIAIFVS